MTTPEVRRPEGISHQNGLEQAINLYKQSYSFLLDLSESTRPAYARDLAQFQEYCITQDISSMARQIGSENIRNWLCQLREAGKAPATVMRKSSSLSTFLNWAQAERIIQPYFTIGLPKSEPVEKKQPRILTDEEVDLLISKARNLRDASLILIALRTGATIAEIVNLNAEDILRTGDDSIAIRFKGGIQKNQPRTLEVDKKTGSKIAEYIQNSGLKPEDPLFREFHNRYGRRVRLTRQGAHLILKRYRREIGVENLNPRMLRYTFIANFTGTSRELEEVLGRRNPKTARSAYSPRRLLKI